MRTIRHTDHTDHTGPGRLRLRLPAGTVSVVADPGAERASVALSPQRHGDPAAAAAIERAEATQSGDLLEVVVPDPVRVSGVTQNVVRHDDGSLTVFQHADVVTGSMTGLTIEDGRMIVGSVSGQADDGGGDVRAVVRVPAGHRVDIAAGAADVKASGPLAGVHATIGTGDLAVAEAGDADLRTGAGRVVLERVGGGRVRTGSGSITVRAVAGPLFLSAGSGDVFAHLVAQAEFTATTGFGDIYVTAAPGVDVDPVGLRARCGRVSTP
uniref:hypothetical protein n=1 Tax=Amycolatopsis sp. CA-096443 TaxID=3239919 RepID=UPI003F492BBA